MMRRLLIIPFHATFTEETKDVHLVDTLKGELAGIFNRAMEGYQRFIDNNKRFTDAQAIKDSVERYQEENDSIATWVAEETEQSPTWKVPFKEAYYNYRNYCDSMGLFCETSTKFARHVYRRLGEDSKIKYYHDGKQIRGIKGF
jgi:putative DNA primase/helicase